MWWPFSCFKPDPSKDDVKTAIKISKHEEEDRITRQKIEERVEDDTNKAIEESLKDVEEKANNDEERRLQQESKEKGKSKQVENKGQITPPSICNGCKTEIGDGINAFGALWHPQCLCCLYCDKPIDVHEIYKLKQQFHKPCYKEHCRPSCYICDKKVPRTEKGIKYHEHPFWKDKYCPSHDDEIIAKCCSCERLESYGTTYVMLEDNRRLCCQCMESAVMDTYECVSLHIEMREFFQDNVNMKVDKEFPLLLVEKDALNKAEKEENIDNQYGIVTRGICLSEEQTVPSIAKRPRMGPNKRLMDMVREDQRVTGLDVTAILILYGFPRLLTGYLLAHEMMHAWLRIKGYRNLDIVLEEGLCQVLAYMWLEPQTYATPEVTTITTVDSSSASSSSRTPPSAATTSKKGDQSDFEKRFVEFCKYQIETDDSPIYGLGFKQVHQMMISNGHDIMETLREIVRVSKTTPKI